MLTRLRVGTRNPWGMRGAWEERLPVLASGLRALGADVVTLQETILTDAADQAAELLGPGYRLGEQRGREPAAPGSGRAGRGERGPAGQGIPTGSRWPVGEVHELDLHVTERTHDFACTTL